MDLKNFFNKVKEELTPKEPKSFNIDEKSQIKHAPKVESQSHWIKCPSCESMLFFKEVEHLNHICPKCNFHMRIGANKRIQLLADENSFVEHDSELHPNDPLKFVDSKPYQKRLDEAYAATGKTSSIISGSCEIFGTPVELVIFDFAFLGGSLGSVEGEKIVRACNRAMEKNHGVIIVSASGGARMQESTYALMQMAKTSAALRKLDQSGLPFISLLTDPTFGGVSASFAFLGDILIAEPGALIGFAGARVIKQTIGKDLPEGFQKAEFLLEHGSIDMVVDRSNMKKTIGDLLKIFQKEVA
ncbi:MAG: acetyl-CoA carboxylase carboxyltransferase subunit beta [Arcobacter sp.]|nr:acetyl-CoA carboxylase carboxyltransferase subunit beta [Arcobacter sp.]